MAYQAMPATQAYHDFVEELGKSSALLTPGNLVAAVRRACPRDDSQPKLGLLRQLHALLKFVETGVPGAAVAASSTAALHTCIKDAAADPGLHDPLPAVLAALRDADELLGQALAQPGMLAAAAAWDPDAAPALCILAVASDRLRQPQRPGRPNATQRLLQPAAVECLRLVAHGGAAPLLSPRESAACAVLLAEEYCKHNRLDDEASLMQLLHYCSAALTADVSATPLPPAQDAADAAASPSLAAGVAPPDGQFSAEVLGCEELQLLPKTQGDPRQPTWQSMWLQPVTLALQALTRIPRAPRRPCPGDPALDKDICFKEVSPAAVGAYAAGAEALLAHEAAVQRGLATIGHKTQDVLEGVMRLGPDAAAAQRALVTGVMNAICGVVTAWSTQSSSMWRATPEVAALGRLASLARGVAKMNNLYSCRAFDEPPRWNQWATALAVAMSVALNSAAQQSSTVLGGGHGGSHGGAGRSDSGSVSDAPELPAMQRPQQQQQQQDHCLQHVAFHLAEAAVLLLLPAATSDLDTLERAPVLQLLTSLAVHCRIRPEALQIHVQACLENDEREEEWILHDCVHGLVKAAAVLEAAVTTVVGAAERPAQQQPSSTLVTASCISVGALLELAMLQFKHFSLLGTLRADGMQRVLQAIQRRAELATRLVRACGAIAAGELRARNVLTASLLLASTTSQMLGTTPSALQPLLATLRALAALLRAQRPTLGHAPHAAEWPHDHVATWEDMISKMKQGLPDVQPPMRRLLVERGLQEVSDALAAVTEADVAAGSAGGGALAQTQAASEAAMRELLATEEGRTAAAAPSRAAEKRARKKAAARAAAAAGAAAAPEPAVGLPQRAQPCGIVAGAAPDDGHPAAADAASRLQCMGLAGGTTGHADAGQECDTPVAATAVEQQQQQQPQRPHQQKQAAPWMLCPITKGVMARATLCVGDGHSYDESAICEWLQTHSTSPVTGQPLASKDLLPNHALRRIIEAAGPQ